MTIPRPHLELTPHGVVVYREESGELADRFAESDGAGLITLGGQKPEPEADVSVMYWRNIGGLYLRALCRVPEAGEEQFSLPVPEATELADLIVNAPPMRGAEYLSQDVLTALWERMTDWVRAQRVVCKTLAGVLAIHAPLWSRVGRVVLHLAENKNDEDHPFAFLATYASGLSQAGRIQQKPLGAALKEFAGAQNKAALLKLLSPIHQAALKSPFLNDLVTSGDIFHPLSWSAEEAYAFLREVEFYEAAGLAVRLPNWWQKKGRRPTVSVTIGQSHKGKLGLDALLDFRLDVVVDGQKLSAEERQTLLAGGDGLVLLRGQWMEVDREKLREALEHWEAIEKRGGVSFVEGMRLLAGAPANLKDDSELESHRGWAYTQPGKWLAATLATLRDPAQLHPPKALSATLRPYQQTGMNWLWFCAQTGLGACLADDMGLGKTIQVLAALLRRQEENPDAETALLVVPASLIGNWKREAAKFAPSLRLHIAHRSEGDEGAASPTSLRNTDVVVTTYGMLTRADWITKKTWGWVIIDEAQAIKNSGSKQSRAVRALKAHARFALTGTPIENQLGDLWSLFDFINPGLLGTSKDFIAFEKALRTGNQERYAPLRRLVGPYILRRLKTDKSIISDLPEKTEMKIFCGLFPEQAKLYQQSVETLMREIVQVDGIRRRGLVLSYLMRFKQICNHPDQLLGHGDYAPARSAKFQRLAELCSEIESRGEKVLIFTQFREMTEPLSECLTAVFGRAGLILHGGTPVKKRQEMVESFQREDGPPFFVLSLKAGGTGLNLTAASHVVHFDRWWNPAVENQATDRAFRIGQKCNVLVHKFVTSGTLEEKIDQLLTDKQEMADSILVGDADKALSEMSDSEILNLVSLDIKKAEANL